MMTDTKPKRKISLKRLSLLPVEPSLIGEDSDNCQRCGLSTKCTPPLLNTIGAVVTFVLDYPDEYSNTVKKRIQSISHSLYGWEKKDVNFVYSLKCAVKKPDKEYAFKNIQACRGYLLYELLELNPIYIIAVGQLALKSLVNNGDATIVEYCGKEFEIPGLDGTKAIAIPNPREYEEKRNPYVIQEIRRSLQRLTEPYVECPPETKGKLKHEILGFDTEFRTSDNTVWTASFCDGHRTRTLDMDELYSRNLPDVLANCTVLAGHFIQVDLDQLIKLGLATNYWMRGEHILDSWTLAKLTDENRPLKGGYGLQDQLLYHFHSQEWKNQTVVLSESDPETWGKELRQERCRVDAWGARLLCGYHTKEFDTEMVYQPLIQFAHRLQLTLHRIKLTGAMVDMQTFEEMEARLSKDSHTAKLQLEQLARNTYGLPYFEAGNNFHTADLLYKKLKLPVIKRTASGMPSTDKDVLSTFESHPVVQLVGEHRNKTKLLNTWFGSEDRVSKSPPLKDRLHLIQLGERRLGYLQFKLNNFGARTGRRSGDSPNPQNWPKTPTNVRKIIVSRFEGGKIGAHDFEKLEVFLSSWVIQSPSLYEYFKHKGGYLGIAKELFKADIPKDTKEYVAVKSTCLGIQYNAYPKTIARTLWYKAGVKLDEDYEKHTEKTKKLWYQYHEMFPEYGRYKKEVERELLQTGQIVGALGYTRHLPCPNGKDTPGYYHLLNEAINFRIQWLAALCTGTALLDIEETLVNAWYEGDYVKYHTYLLDNANECIYGGDPEWNNHPHIINEVHDEITMDYPGHGDGGEVLVTTDCMTQLKTLRRWLPEFDLDLSVETTLSHAWHEKEV